MTAPRANRRLKVVLSTTSLVLPSLTLIPFGSLWLYERGYLLYWAVAAVILVALVMGLQWWVLRRSKLALADETIKDTAPERWSERERQAWQDVEAFANGLKPDDVSGETALKGLALDTIRRVAARLHPSDANPLWNFTVPDALLLTERVAQRLRPVVVENIPLGDQLTVQQVLKLYQWRGAVDWAERAYDIWRIVRLLNPATAIANEARERMSKKVYSSLRDEFTVRLAQGYVREVGRSAIDLYGGRLGGAHIAPRPIDEAAVHASDADVVAGQRRFSWRRLGRQAKNVGKASVGSIFRRK